MSNPLIEAFDTSVGILGDSRKSSAHPARPVVIHSEGSSDRNEIEVELTDGRMTACAIREDALGLDPEQLAAHIMTATNRALEQADAATVTQLQAQQGTDLNQLTQELAAISAQAERGMERYLGSMRELLQEASKAAPA